MAPRDVHRNQAVTERAPYCALASLYDRVMVHVDYDAWVRLIGAIIRSYLPQRAVSVFEIGGGTGVLGRKLSLRDVLYHGSDRCFPMCRQSTKKGIPFLCADARALPLKTRFDLILFLYDGINYLLSLDDYRHVFDEVHASLDKDGLFLFDITTEANSLKHFQDFLDFEDYGDAAYVRHSYYDMHSRNQHNDFTMFIRDKRELFTKHVERHVQRVFDVGDIKRAVPKNKFEILGIWDGYSFKKHTPRSARIHFLLRKI